MINYTSRLDSALRTAAWAHEKAGQHRKGTDIPYIIHPVGVMMMASNVTSDEDVLIACLLHDILEDVDSSVYGESDMRRDFGDRVIDMVKDVTHNDEIKDWHMRSQEYLNHLEQKASNEAIIVSACDKIHNLQSVLIDLGLVGEQLWARFATKNSADQLWWYGSIFEVAKKRQAPQQLVEKLDQLVGELKNQLKIVG